MTQLRRCLFGLERKNNALLIRIIPTAALITDSFNFSGRFRQCRNGQHQPDPVQAGQSFDGAQRCKRRAGRRAGRDCRTAQQSLLPTHDRKLLQPNVSATAAAATAATTTTTATIAATSTKLFPTTETVSFKIKQRCRHESAHQPGPELVLNKKIRPNVCHAQHYLH